jgi:hypothetical protein
MGRLRATTSTGAVVDDPGAAELAALVGEVRRAGAGAFVVLERGVGRSYLQAVFGAGAFAVEYCAGRRRLGAGPVDAGRLTALLAAWATA